MLAQIARTAVFLAFLAAAIPQARAQSPAVAVPVQRMVILRNGEVVEGKVTLYEGTYIVDLPIGRIRIKQADVDLVCSNLEEGYRRKRSVIQVGNVHNHLDLAQWCMRHNLFGLATVELADATAADPKNPMIAALQHRLKMALEPPLPAEKDRKKPLAPGPSNDELDRMVRGMPRGIVETFTQSVQPLLLNNCATAGCHGPQSETGLRFWHIAAGRPSSRRTTQRNLYSALQFIDRANPSASKLLTAAAKPHGTAKHAILGEHQAVQYRRMLDWASQIGRNEATEQPESVARHSPPEVVEPPFDAEAPQRLPSDAGKARPITAANRRRPPRDASAAGKKDRATPASFDHRADPFDPEGFNRRYGPKKPGGTDRVSQ
jgi:hypothetical protein